MKRKLSVKEAGRRNEKKKPLSGIAAKIIFVYNTIKIKQRADKWPERVRST